MKPLFLTAFGAFDSHKLGGANPLKAGKPYGGIAITDMGAMVIKPSSCDKANAQFFIPSVYREHDERLQGMVRSAWCATMVSGGLDQGAKKAANRNL